MAVTQNSYTGNGSTTNYSFTFPYLKASDIKASIDAVDTTAFTLANATTVQFNTAPANGAKIKIFRETGIDSLSATFYAGSAIKSEDLNDNFTQNLYVTQEVNGRYISALGGTMTGNFNMGEDADIVFEGATDDAHETTLTVADPTADRTITLPNVTGTVITTGDTGTVATGMIAADAVNGTKIADDSINSEHYVDGSIDTAHIADAQITTAKIADSNVTTGKLAADAVTAAKLADNAVVTANIVDANVTTAKLAADAVNGTKIADNSINSEHYVDGSIDNAHLADNSVTLAKMADDSVGTTELVDGSVVTAALADNSVTLSKMADNSVGTSELVDDAVTEAKIANDAVRMEHILANNVTSSEIASNAVTTAKIADNAVSIAKIADAELSTLAGMLSGTASKLADSTALTADIADLNQIDGLTKQTTISNSDASFPTSGAVVDYVAAQLSPIGGLAVIATEVAFPNTQPVAGVVISIADAGGIVVNGSGTSTTGRTVGGSTVTINGINSAFNSTTVDAGVSFMVSSTGSGQIYNFHKATLKEADILNLSNDINDFGNRYRVFAGEPTSNNDEGDLVYDTNANKMKVYDSSTSALKEVTSTGEFKYLFLCPAGGSGAPTINGSIATYDLREGSNSGAAASVTNAAQLIVSINGVIQKPNTGTSAPSEGFALVDTNTIVFGSNLPSGADVYIIQVGSAVSIPTPGDDTVSSAKIQSGAVVQAKVGNEAINEAKLQVSNTPTNGYYLQAQSGNTGGLTWAAVPNPDLTQLSASNLTSGTIPDARFPATLPAVSGANLTGLGSGCTGGGTDEIFWENGQTVTTNYTITNNKNAMSAGPITINNGIAVTIGTGENWTIV